jgi:hypothetical protein
MRQCPFQQFIADAATLLTGGDEQLSEKPQIATDPTKAEAEDLTRIFCYPQAIGIVLQGKHLKVWRTRARHRPKAVTFGEFIDAAHDQLVRSFQIFGAGKSVSEWHRGSSAMREGDRAE